MNDAAVAGRRARGGGGSARRAERTAVSFDVAGYIRRNIPNFEILNDMLVSRVVAHDDDANKVRTAGL
jgi:trimethylamine--corrinoid protein Co-methyltransferase